MRITTSRSRGSAVIVVLAILGILTLYVLANMRTLHRLSADVRRLEQRQLRRLQPTVSPVVITNGPVLNETVAPTTNSIFKN